AEEVGREWKKYDGFVRIEGPTGVRGYPGPAVLGTSSCTPPEPICSCGQTDPRGWAHTDPGGCSVRRRKPSRGPRPASERWARSAGSGVTPSWEVWSKAMSRSVN